MATANDEQQSQMHFRLCVLGDAVETLLLERVKNLALLHLLQKRRHQTQGKLRLGSDGIGINHIETVWLSQFLSQIYAVAIF